MNERAPQSRILAVALLAGTVLLGITAVAHPVLRGDAASHLRIIADASHWRAVHLGMLAATAFIMAGIWVRLMVSRASPPLLIAALALITVGLGIHALNVSYMAGTGWQLAARFAQGEGMMAAIYDVTHPIGLMAARFGNFIVALGALALGWVEWRDADSTRVLAVLAWAAALGGFVGTGFFHESSPAALGAAALLSGWQVVVALRVVTGRFPGSAPG